MNNTNVDRGGAAAWLCIFFVIECLVLAGCATASLRKAYDAAGKYIPAPTEPAKPPAEPSGEASEPGAPPAADPAPSPAAPAVTVSGLRLNAEGKPDWTDVRWYDAVLKDDGYWYEGVKQ
jgi:hypothetical protein